LLLSERISLEYKPKTSAIMLSVLR